MHHHGQQDSAYVFNNNLGTAPSPLQYITISESEMDLINGVLVNPSYN